MGTLDNPHSRLDYSPDSFCEYLCFQRGTTDVGLPIPKHKTVPTFQGPRSLLRAHIDFVATDGQELRDFLDWYAQYIAKGHVKREYQYYPNIDDLAIEEAVNNVESVNAVLQHESCIYRIFADNTNLFAVYRIGSESLQATAIEPALRLLRDCDAKEALAEYERALLAIAKGDTRNAILNSSHAFESTMKYIIGRRAKSSRKGNEKDNPRALIQIIVNELKLLPAAYQSLYEQFMAVLLGVNTVRNNAPGAGHGPSPGATPPDSDTAELAVNLAGAQILYLLRRHMQK